MKSKEAILEIERLLQTMEQDLRSYEPAKEALLMAMDSLEKQVPEKITEIHCDEYYCPICGAENLCDQYQVTDKFCPNCGQALDWSEEE